MFEERASRFSERKLAYGDGAKRPALGRDFMHNGIKKGPTSAV